MYDDKTEVETVLDREFNRLNKALEMKLNVQDDKLMKK